MISHQYNCIYIHIPKTAGTSIEYRLGHFKELKRGVQDHSTIRDIEPLSFFGTGKLFLEGKWRLLYRRTRRLVRGLSPISQEQFKKYFKFTFVRNPWSRVFPWYRNVMRDDLHRKSLKVPSDCTFEVFLRKYMGRGMLRPQLYWIQDGRGKIPLDFIGRYENVEKDFAQVCDVLGLKDKTLPDLLPGDNPPYVQFYNPQMKNLVAKTCAEEIKLFKFEFGE